MIALLGWPGQALAASFDCVSGEQRIRELAKDIEKDAADYRKLKGQVDELSGRPLGDAQMAVLTRLRLDVLYLRKVIPATGTRLKTEIRRARQYKCLPATELDSIEHEANATAEIVASDRPPS